MKNLKRLILCVIILSATVFGQNAANNIEGNWLGAIEVSGMKMRLGLRVSKSADVFIAKLDSIDQGANNLPIESISQQNNSVRFEAKNLGLSYEGTINEKGDEITGQLKQGAGVMPLVFRRVSEVPKLGRRQDPQKPYPYDEEEVSYANAKDGNKLAGTLTLPRAGEQSPAVILITGSGAQDRDETVAGHRPFLVLADYLTRRGIAVLRVDDRGVGGSTLGSADATSENFAGDVLAGIEYLKSRKEINPKKIGLVGHSEGGMIAPMAAARSQDVAFIVLMAGLGQTGADVIYTQTELIQKAGGASQEITAQTIALQKNINAVLNTERDNKIAEQKIREAIEKQTSQMTEEQKKVFAPVKTALEAQIPMYLSGWFRYFVAFDPRSILTKVQIPVLAINGERDLQVAARENLGLIEAGLKAGGNSDVTTIAFPKLNHLFQTSETGSPGEYGKIEETISPQVLETIADWILKRAVMK